MKSILSGPERYEAELRDTMVEYGIPDYMHDGVVNYVIHGQVSGDFLMAVFRNDLADAAVRADQTNSQLFRQYAWLTHNAVPAAATGSQEKVAKWIDDGGFAGIDKAIREKVEKEETT